MVKKAPRKVTKAIDNSVVGQKMMDAGTQAKGGIGRRISNGGKKISRKYLLTASASPNGMPMIWAIMKPRKTRKKLRYQLSQYPGLCTTEYHVVKTSLGGGTFPTHQISIPNHALNWAPISQSMTKAMIAITPRQTVLLLIICWKADRRKGLDVASTL